MSCKLANVTMYCYQPHLFNLIPVLFINASGCESKLKCFVAPTYYLITRWRSLFAMIEKEVYDSKQLIKHVVGL
jgi:hypothetical protein